MKSELKFAVFLMNWRGGLAVCGRPQANGVIYSNKILVLRVELYVDCCRIPSSRRAAADVQILYINYKLLRVVWFMSLTFLFWSDLNSKR